MSAERLNSVENSSQVTVENPKFNHVGECLYRHSKTGIYYALVKKRGKQHRKSLKTPDRKLADRLVAEFRSKVSKMVSPTKDRFITFKELSEDWLKLKETRLKPSSARGTAVYLKQLNRFLGQMSVRNITSADCHRWEINRGSKLSESGFNQERGVLVGVLDYAVKEGLLLENPAIKITRRKQPKRKLIIPTETQLALLVKTIRLSGLQAQHGANLVEVLAYSGMRLSEATNLLWRDIDFERGLFTVTGGLHGTKNHEERTVPLFPAFRDLLRRLQQGKMIRPDQRIITINTAKKAMSHACKKVELPHFHHHLLRHFFVSQAIEQNVDFKTIASWVGHKDGGVLVAKTYGHLRDDHSNKMAQKMTFNVLS